MDYYFYCLTRFVKKLLRYIRYRGRLEGFIVEW